MQREHNPDKDPIILIREIVNLKELYAEKLALLSPMAGEQKSFNAWDLRHLIPGYYHESPQDRWYDKEVFVEGLKEYGKGHIIAMKQVGDFYIPGVQLSKPIPNGHSLAFRDHGQAGLDGHCIWVWLDKVKLWNQDSPAG